MANKSLNPFASGATLKKELNPFSNNVADDDFSFKFVKGNAKLELDEEDQAAPVILTAKPTSEVYIL